MLNRFWIALLFVVSWHVGVLDASAGDVDARYRACVKECQETGCVGERCFPHCKFSSKGVPFDGPWYMQEPLYLKWKQWDCQGDCRYHCMIDREKEREALGTGPVKYHGKWPFKRVYGIQRCGSDGEAGLLIGSGVAWVLIYSFHTKKFQREGRGF